MNLRLILPAAAVAAALCFARGAFSAASAEEAASAAPLTGHIINCAESVHVRRGPGTEYEIVAEAPADAQLPVTAGSEDGAWYEITVDGVTGWVNSYYIKVTVPEKPLAEYTEEERYRFLFDTDVTYWTTRNKPKGYRTKSAAMDHMTKVTVKVWLSASRGRRVSGKKTITVNRKLASEVKQIFKEIYELPEKFPIDTLVGFRWNTAGEVTGPLLKGTTCMSAHAYGAAIDINMYQNDYYVGPGQDFRDTENKFYITDAVKDVFARHGWYWGGDFSICTDTMHFQYTGLDMLTYNNGSPYEPYSLETTPKASGYKIKNIRRRLNKLGYAVKTGSRMDAATDRAIRAFQRDHGMAETGLTDEAFYCLLYNLTPTMTDHS